MNGKIGKYFEGVKREQVGKIYPLQMSEVDSRVRAVET